VEAKTAPPISEVAAATKRQSQEEAAEMATAFEAAQESPAVKHPAVEQLHPIGTVEAQQIARLYHETVENFDEVPQRQVPDSTPESEQITTVWPMAEHDVPQDISRIEAAAWNDADGFEEVGYTEADLPLVAPSTPVNSEAAASPMVAAETDETLAEEAQSTAVEAWKAVLSKEPAELYEAFANALEQFGESTTAATKREEGLVGPEQPTPRIVTVITERLTDLDVEEKEPVALAMRDVIGALHGLQVLEARHADPEAIMAVERQLTELCTVLLEQLEIDYTEQDVRDFVAVLRQPNFMPEATVESGTNVKDLGTHEMKYFARMTGAAADIGDNVMSALGTFALNGLGLRGAKESI
jgi:hypothetical protein